MVDKGYLVDEPPPPSPLRTAFDQRVVPALIDAAGSVEVRAEALATSIRRHPATCLSIAAGMGFLLALLARSRRA